MRLRSFELKGVGPIEWVSVGDLADVIVLAGPNGVGKTSINNALLNLARNASTDPNRWMVLEATDDDERGRWGKTVLDTRDGSDAQRLRQHLQRSQRRNRYRGAFLNFESDRSIRNVNAFGFTWDVGDPFAEDVGWDVGFSSLETRYNELRFSLFRLVEAQRRQIAEEAIRLKASGSKEMQLTFGDVLKPFKDAFLQLLAPKEMVEVNVKDQQIYYQYQGTKLPFTALSSGEREVVNIVFDFILRGPSHCIVIFDEPELHLHPELAYKLLQTLSRVGERNQFLFSTHSPEIISASLENTVVFVSPPKRPTQNQAIVVNRDDETHHALQTLGQSIGVISLGKKLVLIEGEESSLDKQTYGAILKGGFPEFILVPVGGRDTIRSFDDIRDNILNKTIWGVDFYLLCDRDAVNTLGPKSVDAHLSTKIKKLPRYHLENYFLDENVLAKVFAKMEPTESWLCDPLQIAQRLRVLARSVIPYAVALNVAATIRELVGNVSILPKGVDVAETAEALVALTKERLVAESSRISGALDHVQVESLITTEFTRLHKAVDDSDPQWKADLPGRVIFDKFAASTRMISGRLKQLYLAEATAETFKEVVDIFETFKRAA